MIHLHVTSWTLAIILFLVTLGLSKAGKAKGQKIVHMITRLFYILIIISGAILLFNISTIGTLYIIKSLVGIFVISMLEMILVNNAKGKRTGVLWILLVISLFAVLYLGFSMPLGSDLF
ncbi:YisL family protein [Bacillus massilinigeriensis]|uniref:YisL family protein n=1 Tax=Bacillus massilionigeriensis TaxID=1805475 RepID=UPI00096B3123|nr:YisL family protein [Bacillus massilionigeriensis]